MRAGKERGICLEECGKRRTRLSYQARPRRFFEESKAFLTEFVGAENVVSTMVHMDEKTSHMHFSMCRSRRTGDPTPTKFIRVRVCENCNPNFPRICKAEVLPLNEAWSRCPVPPKSIWIPASSNSRKRNWHVWPGSRCLDAGFLAVTFGILGQREAELKKSIEVYAR